jgi:1-acyl-sn-glycerol-3-phosphate acyltransferase
VFCFFIFLKKKDLNFFVGLWGRCTCWLYGVRLQIFYPENISPGGFLLLFNHSSFFDIFALSAVLPDLRYGAKIQLFQIPIFGLAMKCAGIIPIDREHREKSIEALHDNRDRFSKGLRVALSPEGGRVGSDSELSPFKSGPFYFVLSGQGLIQPVLLQGAQDVWSKGSLFPGMKSWTHTLDLVFLPPISTESYTLDQRKELKDHVYSVMKKALHQWRQDRHFFTGEKSSSSSSEFS